MVKRLERTQVLLEPEHHRALIEIAQRENTSVSEVLRRMIDEQLRLRRKQALAQAAEALRADYESDQELTAFTALDGEDFYAQG